uniref:Uncharacterized protein n=2 Tax=Timema TaxID=61471 RepID=A0A7R9EWR1_9NEOP|nr:unnamed protein product [Timema bartmani]
MMLKALFLTALLASCSASYLRGDDSSASAAAAASAASNGGLGWGNLGGWGVGGDSAASAAAAASAASNGGLGWGNLGGWGVGGDSAASAAAAASAASNGGLGWGNLGGWGVGGDSAATSTGQGATSGFATRQGALRETSSVTPVATTSGRATSQLAEVEAPASDPDALLTPLIRVKRLRVVHGVVRLVTTVATLVGVSASVCGKNSTQAQQKQCRYLKRTRKL